MFSYDSPPVAFIRFGGTRMSQERIGRYQVIEEIASGMQGAVYEALDVTTNQMVALKVLHPTISGSADYIERFEREARIMASIDHPNVVKVLDFGREEGRYYLALELLPGSLGRILSASESLPIDGAVHFAIQIADGVAAAHSAGVTHRDIKPQNVLIDRDGVAKVTDFGIARAESLASMTGTGTMLGTPYYMSPEQSAGELADARSDVYALGCVLYELLSGETVFDGTTPLAVLRKHMDEQPRPIRVLRDDVPQELAEIVMRSLQKDPDLRQQTAAELASALRVAMPEPADSMFAPGVDFASLAMSEVSSRSSDSGDSGRSVAVPGASAMDPESPDPNSGSDNRRGKRIAIFASLVVIIGVIAGSIFVISDGSDTSGDPLAISTETPAPVADTALSPEASATSSSESTSMTASIPSEIRGQDVFVNNGCSACHSTGSEDLVGPGLAGLLDRAETRDAGQTPDEYILASILDPGSYVVEGYANVMPTNFGTEISKDGIRDLIAYLATLSAPALITITPTEEAETAIPTLTTSPMPTVAPTRTPAATAAPAQSVDPAITATEPFTVRFEFTSRSDWASLVPRFAGEWPDPLFVSSFGPISDVVVANDDISLIQPDWSARQGSTVGVTFEVDITGDANIVFLMEKGALGSSFVDVYSNRSGEFELVRSESLREFDSIERKSVTLDEADWALPVATSTYDDFDDNSIDFSKWLSPDRPPWMTVEEANGRLEITHASDAHELPGEDSWGSHFESRCTLAGDFDVQVDFELVAWPDGISNPNGGAYGNGVRMALVTNAGILTRSSWGPDPSILPGEVQNYHFSNGDGDEASLSIGNISGSHELGGLRLERTGTSLIGYFQESPGGDWVAIGTVDATTEPTYVALNSWSHDELFAGKEVTVAFDNLKVNAESTVCP